MLSLKGGKTDQPESPTETVAAPLNGILKTDPDPKRGSMTVAKALPSFDELPKFHEFNGCAWDVWGKDDELGTINLLTEDVVQRATREEVRYVVS